MGVAAGGLLRVFLIGLLMHAWLVQKLYGWAERLLYRIPLIRSVYGSIRDLFNLFSLAQEHALHQSIVLTPGEMRVIGFQTIIEMNRYGCPRIAERISKVFGVDIDKSIVRKSHFFHP